MQKNDLLNDPFFEEPASIKALNFLLEFTSAERFNDLARNTSIENDLEDDVDGVDGVINEWTRSDDRYDSSRLGE